MHAQAGLSLLLVAHTTFLEISCRGSFVIMGTLSFSELNLRTCQHGFHISVKVIYVLSPLSSTLSLIQIKPSKSVLKLINV